METLSSWYTKRIKRLLCPVVASSLLLLSLFSVAQHLEMASRQSYIVLQSSHLIKLGVLQQNRVLVENSLDSITSLVSADWTALCKDGQILISVNIPFGSCPSRALNWQNRIIHYSTPGLDNYEIVAEVPFFSRPLEFLGLVGLSLILFGFLFWGLLRTGRSLQNELIRPLLSDWTETENFKIKELIDIGKNRFELEERRRTSAVASALLQNNRQIAHDIRSPLSALNLLTRNKTHIGSEDLDILRKAVERIGAISAQMLSERSQGKLLEPAFLIFDVCQLINELVVEFTSSRGLQTVSISCEGLNTPIYLSGDRTSYGRIFSNILANSYEALDQSHDGRIHCTVARNQSTVSIIFHDNGCGMNESLINKIGTGPITFNKEHGHGLGLQFSKSYVEKCGGQFKIYSDGHTYTKIEIELKLARPEYSKTPSATAIL